MVNPINNCGKGKLLSLLNDTLGCWTGNQVTYFYFFTSCSFLFPLDRLQGYVCLSMRVCVCIFLYCLLVYNSTGSFIKYGGRPTRCLAGEYNDELTPVWRGWPFSFRTGCQRRDLQKAPMLHKEKKKKKKFFGLNPSQGGVEDARFGLIM